MIPHEAADPDGRSPDESDPATTRLTWIDGIGVARMRGNLSAQDAIRWISATLEIARDAPCRRVLVSTLAATGFRSPSLARRVEMIREWAGIVGDQICVALVCPPEFIDPQKFGITVARRFGMTANVFTDEETALAWLRRLT